VLLNAPACQFAYALLSQPISSPKGSVICTDEFPSAAIFALLHRSLRFNLIWFLICDCVSEG